VVWLGWWLLVPIGLLVAIVVGTVLWLHHEKVADDRHREEDALRRRADQQQAWRLAGDPRGFHGEYPPAI
jgi:hypothetical protein